MEIYDTYPEINGFVIVDDMQVILPSGYPDKVKSIANGYTIRTDGKIGLNRTLTQEIIETIRQCQRIQ